jgi:hypothetical protein
MQDADAVMLVLGLSMSEGGNKLSNELKVLFREAPPAALLLVNGRGEDSLRNVVSAPSAYAAAAAVR